MNQAAFMPLHSVKFIYRPHSGWVEQDAQEIWTTQIAVVQQALASAHLLAKDIKALGLTNQRETTVVG